MVRRGEITDQAWQRIEPLLPEYGQSGGQWPDHRTVVDGILWKLRTGSPWRDLPERYGPWQTCYDRLVRWRRDGTWDRLLAHAQTKSDAVGEIQWEVSVDDTVVRAHQHAAGARGKPSAADQKSNCDRCQVVAQLGTMTIVDAEGRELPLVGGRQTPGVVRVGDTVRRPTRPHSPFVHDLLRHLEAVGFEGAPKLLGVDERGREILTYVEGEVAHDHERYSPSDARLANTAVTIRRFHDATAGSSLAAGAEIVAHNELGPHNTVFVGDEPVAFIDWDDAAPGTRLFDLANAVWSFVDVGEGGGPVAEQARRVRLMCDAYGWDDTDAIVDEIRADLGRALANHEWAGRRKAADIFREMVRWMDENGGKLKALAAASNRLNLGPPGGPVPQDGGQDRQ